jgi:hypothetical protein
MNAAGIMAGPREKSSHQSRSHSDRALQAAPALLATPRAKEKTVEVSALTTSRQDKENVLIAD